MNLAVLIINEKAKANGMERHVKSHDDCRAALWSVREYVELERNV
jgi:hypothetical protein